MTIIEALPPGGSSDRLDPLMEIWARLSKPFDVVRTVSALVGLPQAEVAQAVGSDIANSFEAEALMLAMPHTLRSLATSLQTQTERCVGSIRGPVLWSETMSARASSFGDEGLFVCKTPSRAYDIDENRVLVAALNAVREAAQAAEHNNQHALDDPVIRAARRRGLEANRYLEHPSLASVTRERPKPRAMKRTRSGKHRKSYQPAIAMLDRAANPLDLDDGAGPVRRADAGPARRAHRVDPPAGGPRPDPAAPVPGGARCAVLGAGAVLPLASAG